MEKRYYIDIFSGCGGLSLGLFNSGKWKGLLAIEKSPMAFETLRYNLIDKKKHFEWVDWLPIKSFDINSITSGYKAQLKTLRGNVDLVAGGPPCQGFSSAGKRIENDNRNNLIDSYLKFIELVEPNAIFFENVKGFTIDFKKNKTSGKSFSKKVLKRLDELGYHVKGKLVNFGEYGVPQNRVRFILIGLKKSIASYEDTSGFFKKLNSDKNEFLIRKGLSDKPTLGDAISDLVKSNGVIQSPDSDKFFAGVYGSITSSYQKLLRAQALKLPDSHRFANHRLSTVEKFEYIQRNAFPNKDIGKKIRDKLNIRKNTIILLDDNHLAPTLTTLPDDYIHYSEPRILSVREYARIQSFDDWYEIKGNYTTGGKNRIQEVPRYSQIGNAIAPLFAEQVGLVIHEILKR